MDSTALLEISRFRNLKHLEFGHMVSVNSPMSVPVSLAPFLGQLGARFNFGGAWEHAGPPNLEFPEI